MPSCSLISVVNTNAPNTIKKQKLRTSCMNDQLYDQHHTKANHEKRLNKLNKPYHIPAIPLLSRDIGTPSPVIGFGLLNDTQLA